MKRFLTLSLVLVFTCFIAYAQEGLSFQVKLNSGTITLTPNLTEFVASPNLTKDEQNAQQYYRYVQFNNIPNDAKLTQIKQSGLRLLEYIPNKTYIAAFPKNYNRQLLHNFGVRAVQPIATTHKVQKSLTENIPGWALSGNNVDVVITLHEKMPKSELLSYFFRRGLKVLKVYEDYKIAYVRIPQSAISSVADLPFVAAMEAIGDPGTPEDRRGRALHRSTAINTFYHGGRKFDGSGVKVLVRDDGDVGPHIDFKGRLIELASPGTGTHGDMVAGIMTGAGNIDPSITGQAPAATLYVVDYVANYQDANTLNVINNQGVLITNSSYSNGCNGGYTTITRTIDQQINNNKPLLHVFSAGNSNGQSCGYGAGTQWGNITGGHKIGKNAMAAANLDAGAILQTSSSRGPASDGRIKPDIAANGANQLSTDPNNAYSPGGGTSAAAPSIAGVAAQLYHAYRTFNNGADPESSLIKAAMLNTAEDMGTVGPDFSYGWGRVHGLRALELLEDQRYLKDTIGQGGLNTHTITVPANVAELRVMTYWMEPPASVTAAKALINDIDMTVTDPSTTIHQPYVLNHLPNATTLGNPAVPGKDSMNNVEQVAIMNPAAGTYTVNISGYTIPTGSHPYYVVYEFIMDEVKIMYPLGGEGFVPSTTERIHWDAPGTSGTFQLSYSSDSGTTWNVIVSSVSGANRWYDWFVPNIKSGKVLFKVTRGAQSSTTDTTMTIMPLVQNIQVTQVCPTSMTLTWDSLASATQYQAYWLDSTHVIPVGITDSNSITFTHPQFDGTQAQWVAVAPIKDGGIGRRTNAEELYLGGGGLLNCFSDDIGIAINTPDGQTPSCGSQSVVVELKNNGTNPQDNFSVSYILNGGTPVIETITDTIEGGETLLYNFTTPISVPVGTTNNLIVTSSLAGDLFSGNNSDTTNFSFINMATYSGAFTANFEGFASCGTTSNCGLTVCNLANGWINMTNGSDDDIDWRVDAGGTPSVGTGPSVDHNPGTTNGKYLYLEASSGCNGQEAILLSPCIDLTNAVSPQFSLWYHMDGATMGELHVDFFNGSVWIEDFVPSVSGDQGANWLQLTADLTPYVGNTVNFRIRGITGPSWESDLAIDDFSIFDTAPPAADFEAERTTACVNSAIKFTDFSGNTPTSWDWSFTPNTVTFVNSTSNTTKNPFVEFTATGIYDVQLIVFNQYGSDTITKTTYIDINNGVGLPVTEDFETTMPPANWSIVNSDNGTTWSTSVVTGSNGTQTTASFMDNFNYNAAGQEDDLVTLPIDLSTYGSPELTFDVAYAIYSTTFADGLEVEVSSDCGVTYGNVVYSKSGLTLATAGISTSFYAPADASEWRNETVDLSSFAGSTITIKFININGYGNSLYIDNINIQEAPPTAAFATTTGQCTDSTTFSSNAVGATSYAWDFGTGATPATATTEGPHTVSYASAGTKDVQLIVTNSAGADTIMQQVAVDVAPTADFTLTQQLGNQVVLTNNSTAGATYLWDFGDGNTDTAANPIHNYNTLNTYTITLTVTNACGTATYSETLSVTSTNRFNDLEQVQVFPNPSEGLFNIVIDGLTETELELTVLDVHGKELKTELINNVGSSVQHSLDISEYATGVYILQLRSGERASNIKLIKD